MYWVYSIHSGHAGRGADAITNFYDWGIASRGLEGGVPPKNWFSPKVSERSADVYVTSEDGKLVAVLPDLSNLRTDEAHLWISHGVFLNNDQKFAPEHLDFEVEGVHEYWKRLPLNTDGSADICSNSARNAEVSLLSRREPNPYVKEYLRCGSC